MPYTYDQVIQCSATITGSAAALSNFNAQILDPVSNSYVSVLVIPATQRWFIYDMFTRSTSDVPVDAFVTVIKNGIKRLFISPPLTSLIVTNPSRPYIPTIEFGPNERLNMVATTIAANTSTSAVTDYFYLRVRVIDYSM